ncbi:stage II sporulation protein M [archaeon]|jgi:uncharacterized membrane protein SpoIIM required for sporulation|nr:stage II sporulation protein M [archaeon]MBT6762160.1 stage II sporulation protein M [archaeon]
MVLEHIFPEDWLEKKARYALLLGVGYSLVGILIASILFPGDPALVAVAFTSLLLLPELYKIFDMEERQERAEKKITLKALVRDDWDVVKIYLFLFVGILLTYSFATMAMPSLETNTLFREQLEIRLGQGFAGQAVAGTFSSDLFWSLLNNNFLVMMACFIMALLTGDGAIFLITWNASVWGTIFGYTAKAASNFSGESVYSLYAKIALIVTPHVLIESTCYILAAIAGAVISKDVLLEEFAGDRFMEVFGFNIYLLLFAVLFLILGAGVEAWVLDNVTMYSDIIRMSFLGA